MINQNSIYNIAADWPLSHSTLFLDLADTTIQVDS